ncbi:M24 family metallopeptidase [Nonomuraea endophytica]|uniref:Xaa-Pro dipeptidase n=1 Tax=Nonomuraea endophytica TaxID=714136 RepID=A0A7W8EGN3_9ACTN|nr:M24 family metallopeptidase [Nonomuraea endophytica]MBB5078581.1 Xaa-Pro dipeptidase [Nonomuraea endophytica]
MTPTPPEGASTEGGLAKDGQVEGSRADGDLAGEVPAQRGLPEDGGGLPAGELSQDRGRRQDRALVCGLRQGGLGEGGLAERVGAVRVAMAAAEVDALVLRPSPDFRFLGGRGEGFLVVTRENYAETATPAALVPAAARRVGVDPEMRVRELFGLSVDAELVPAGAVLAPLRLRKDQGELDAIARAAAAADGVVARARELRWFGATERAMARHLRVAMLESGCEEILGVQVAAGEHTAIPAHRPTDRVINPGDALQVAVRGRWDGYCAEVARVLAVAEPPEDFDALYSVVLAAQSAALDGVRQALPVASVARSAQSMIEESGYGQFAAGHFGRGVGLADDEPPHLSPADPATLAPGMALCLEPAVYLPDLFGARLADVAVCTESTPRLLTTPPPALVVLDR